MSNNHGKKIIIVSKLPLKFSLIKFSIDFSTIQSSERFIYDSHHMERTLKIRSSMELERQIAFSRKGHVTNVIAR